MVHEPAGRPNNIPRVLEFTTQYELTGYYRVTGVHTVTETVDESRGLIRSRGFAILNQNRYMRSSAYSSWRGRIAGLYAV